MSAMECGCSIDIDYDYDSSSMWHTKITTKISSRQCSECNRTIIAGEELQEAREYCVDAVGNEVITGNHLRFYMCTDCMSILNEYFCGYSFGSILQELLYKIEEEPDDFATSQLAKLTPHARELVCGMIEDVWANMDEEEFLL